MANSTSLYRKKWFVALTIYLPFLILGILSIVFGAVGKDEGHFGVSIGIGGLFCYLGTILLAFIMVFLHEITIAKEKRTFLRNIGESALKFLRLLAYVVATLLWLAGSVFVFLGVSGCRQSMADSNNYILVSAIFALTSVLLFCLLFYHYAFCNCWTKDQIEYNYAYSYGRTILRFFISLIIGVGWGLGLKYTASSEGLYLLITFIPIIIVIGEFCYAFKWFFKRGNGLNVANEGVSDAARASSDDWGSGYDDVDFSSSASEGNDGRKIVHVYEVQKEIESACYSAVGGSHFQYAPSVSIDTSSYRVTITYTIQFSATDESGKSRERREISDDCKNAARSVLESVSGYYYNDIMSAKWTGRWNISANSNN